MYGKYGEVKVYHEKTLIPWYKIWFLEPGKVKIDMIDYINNMVDDFGEYIKKDFVATPAANNIYEKMKVPS